jgi:hypothetical protein
MGLYSVQFTEQELERIEVWYTTSPSESEDFDEVDYAIFLKILELRKLIDKGN